MPAEAAGPTSEVSPVEPPLVSLAQIRAAAETLRGIALRTPLLAFGPPERREFLKAESLQPIGAFKIRGAYVALASLEPGRARPWRDHLLRAATTPRASPGRPACSGCRR